MSFWSQEIPTGVPWLLSSYPRAVPESQSLRWQLLSFFSRPRQLRHKGSPELETNVCALMRITLAWRGTTRRRPQLAYKPYYLTLPIQTAGLAFTKAKSNSEKLPENRGGLSWGFSESVGGVEHTCPVLYPKLAQGPPKEEVRAARPDWSLEIQWWKNQPIRLSPQPGSLFRARNSVRSPWEHRPSTLQSDGDFTRCDGLGEGSAGSHLQ